MEERRLPYQATKTDRLIIANGTIEYKFGHLWYYLNFYSHKLWSIFFSSIVTAPQVERKRWLSAGDKCIPSAKYRV